MKRCSKCSQTYLDETLNFCLTDGGQLISERSEAMVVMDRPVTTSQVQRKRRPLLWIVPLALIMLLTGGLLGAFLLYYYGLRTENAAVNRPDGTTARPTATPRRSPASSPTPAAVTEPSKTEDKAPTPNDDADEPTPIGWDTTAGGFSGESGRRYTFECPAEGTAGGLWGNDIYTDFSSICTAAVHAGKLTLEKGGTVTIEYKPGRPIYGSTQRNGIKSNTAGENRRSFIVL